VGTVVFPNAAAKFFLTASPQVRAKRRTDELRAKGIDTTFEETLADVIERDERDSGRAVAPLRPAADAILVDCSAMTIEEVVRTMADHVEKRAG